MKKQMEDEYECYREPPFVKGGPYRRMARIPARLWEEGQHWDRVAKNLQREQDEYEADNGQNEKE